MTVQHVDTARSAALMPDESCPLPCPACGTAVFGVFPNGDTCPGCVHPSASHGPWGCLVVMSDGDWLNEPFEYCPCLEPRA